ncbi:MAG: hydroxymethylglutaryl-CoA lyase [Lachnospiraceae bacterium]|nr:hydroxymethylglutaryl-CoA lyase [Lachnospiraceae bacterium]
MAFELVKDIRICEVGLRDGLQNEKTILTVDQKVELLKGMIDAGFKVIEVGSFMHPKKVPQMANTDEVYKAMAEVEVPDDVELRALIPNKRGVDRAVACGCKKVKLNVSASMGHNLANLNRTPAESVAGFAEAVDAAKSNGLDISGSISMAFGSPWDDEIPVDEVKKIVEAYMAVGITEISLSDASGMAFPSQVYNICQEMKKSYPDNKWWLHFHNTRGLGISNIIAGMQAGFTQFDASFAGVGGCPFVPGAAGNVSTEDVLHVCDEMGVNTGVDIDKAIAISKRVVEMIGHSADSYILRAGKSKDLKLELPKGQIKNQTK